MKLSIRRSKAASRDLVDIWVYLAQSDVDAADRQVLRLETACDRLLEYPDIGHGREDLDDDIQILLQDRYLIIYRHQAAERRIVIERIVHGSRELAAILD